jgi:hypothetical protein
MSSSVGAGGVSFMIGRYNAWRMVFSGTIKTAGTRDKSLSLGVFLQFVATRLTVAMSQQNINPTNTRLFAGPIDITDTATSYETSFNLTIDLMTTSGYLDIIQKSGLWQPVPAWTIQASHNSLLDVQNLRGLILARYNNVDDTLLDLCSKNVQAPVTDPGDADVAPRNWAPPPPPPATQVQQIQTQSQGQSNTVLLGDWSYWVYSQGVPLELSWLAYQCWIEYDADHHLALHKPIGTGSVTPLKPIANPTLLSAINGGSNTAQSPISPGQVALGGGGGIPATSPTVAPAASAIAGVTTTVADRIQRLAAPSVTVRLVGYAARLGFPVYPPRLLTFDGKDVTANVSRTSIRYGTWDNASGIPVYMCAWSIEYLVTQPPQQSVPLLANPQSRTDGSGA